jgi:hypothetical protein
MKSPAVSAWARSSVARPVTGRLSFSINPTNVNGENFHDGFLRR